LYIAFEVLDGITRVVSAMFGAGNKGILDWGRSAGEALGILEKKTETAGKETDAFSDTLDTQANAGRTVVNSHKAQIESLRKLSDAYKEVNASATRRLRDEFLLIGQS
jgi:hypothetical protein